MARRKRTIFLHCGWRTASTYLWSRFRALEETISYYEPLHEILAQPSNVQRASEEKWINSKRKHPDERDIFGEFDPLREFTGRVRNYEPRFATQSYFLGEGDEYPPLHRYISMLEDHAEERGRHAVFGFCRSLGRTSWLRKRFPDAYNVVLTRSPYDHWRSSLSQLTENGSPFFVVAPLQIIGENQGLVPELRTLAKEFGIPELPESAPRDRYYSMAFNMGVDITLRLFFEFYALAYSHALSHADQIISVEEFVDNEEYRGAAIRNIHEATGLRISPGELALARYTPSPIDVFTTLDAREISTLAPSDGPISRSAEAVSLYSKAIRREAARVVGGN